MRIYLKEKIGNPGLFSRRYQELKSLLKWVEMAKNELSRSEAMLSRRKTGKTAIMNRSYTQDTIAFFKENNIAWCDDKQWLEYVIP